MMEGLTLEEIYNQVYTAKVHLDRARLSGNGVLTMRTRLGNVLLDNADAIIEGLRDAVEGAKKIASLERDVESLQAALVEADAAVAEAKKNAPAVKGKGKRGDNPD